MRQRLRPAVALLGNPERQVTGATSAAQADGAEISVSAIARAARVDGTFVYRHRDLLEQIHAVISTPPGQPADSLVSRASLQTGLVNAHERNRMLAPRPPAQDATVRPSCCQRKHIRTRAPR
jgi:hypothetical protein